MPKVKSSMEDVPRINLLGQSQGMDSGPERSWEDSVPLIHFKTITSILFLSLINTFSWFKNLHEKHRGNSLTMAQVPHLLYSDFLSLPATGHHFLLLSQVFFQFLYASTKMNICS